MNNLHELLYQVGKLAWVNGEEWRLAHPELMDSYSAVFDDIHALLNQMHEFEEGFGSIK